jgi:hypothetical protein
VWYIGLRKSGNMKLEQGRIIQLCPPRVPYVGTENAARY